MDSKRACDGRRQPSLLRNRSHCAQSFVASLNEMNNVHESRLTALRNRVPVVVVLMLIGSAMVAMGFTGYNTGVIAARRRIADLIMSIMIATLIGLTRADPGVRLDAR